MGTNLISQNKVLKTIWEYLFITAGIVIYVLAWTAILIPGEIVNGGVTGLCAIIFLGTGVPISISFAAINITLLVLAFFILGSGFGIKTIYAIAMSSLLFDIMPRITDFTLVFEDKLFTAIVGATFEAIGIAMTIMKGGSSGGTDIAALIINKFWPVSPGKVYLYSDVFIVASLLLVPGKTINDVIYGYVTMVTFSFVIDWVLLGNKSSVQIMIFSKKYDEIREYILHDLDRGVTILNAQGGYSKEERNVLLVICRKNIYNKVLDAVKAIDSTAFLTISGTNSVYGEGFDEIKNGLGGKKKSSDGMKQQK